MAAGPFDDLREADHGHHVLHAHRPPVDLLEEVDGLVEQLAPEGRLVIPIASRGADMLTVYRREDGEIATEVIGPCRFVPLIGEEGFGD